MIAAALLFAMTQHIPAEQGATEHLIPPKIYRGDALAMTVYVGDVERPTLCGKSEHRGLTTLACTFRRKRLVVMPNPCRYARHEFYARLACHELGHINGWRH